MPPSDVHKKKKKKNLMILALILLWCALIWGVTMVKMANAQDWKPRYVGKNYSGIGVERMPVDTKGPMFNGRTTHQGKVDNTKQQWDAEFYDNADQAQREAQQELADRTDHQNHSVNTQDMWIGEYHRTATVRMDEEHQSNRQRAAHYDKTIESQQVWWDDWSARQAAKQDR